jgi:hypothetical protein
MGDWASWRLLVNLVGAILITYGAWGFWRQERAKRL